MNIQAEKLKIMKMILETDNPGILESIKKIFQNEYGKDFWEYLSPEQHKDIRDGLNDIKEGEVTDYDAFMKEHRK
jgi:hypothetical protein